MAQTMPPIIKRAHDRGVKEGVEIGQGDFLAKSGALWYILVNTWNGRERNGGDHI